MTVSHSSSPTSLPFSSCKLSLRSNKSTKSKIVSTPKGSRSSSPDPWGINLVSRAYRDIPYAPVDPWKPSLLYSIRHIHPDSLSREHSPIASPDHVSVHRHSHLPLESSKVSMDLTDYPFSPHDPRFSTTKPLNILNKRGSWKSEHIGSTSNPRRAHGNRHQSWPYHSPFPLWSPSSNNHERSPCHPRDRTDRFAYEQSRNISDSLRNSESVSPTCRTPLTPNQVPAQLRLPPHASTIIGSQTILGSFDELTAATSPGATSIFQLSGDNHDGTTIMITSNHQYLERIPKLDRPPQRRSRRPPVSPQSLERKSTSRSANSKHPSQKDSKKSVASTGIYISAFLLDTIPRQIYLYFLLCLPYMYFSRVTHIFEEAEMSLPKIKQGVIDSAREHRISGLPHNWRFGPPVPSAAYINLQRTWELFVDSLMREWRTLNIISVLLLGAILSVLQIETAINDPVAVYAALLSMMCALMSLLYGCVYIIRFGSMRKVSKAAMWAAEAQRTTTCILWNVWVFLAMPAAWLAWSMLLYIVCIMSLVWRTGPVDNPKTWTLTSSQALFPRATITAVLALGAIYFALIMNTLRRYGHMMDRAWHNLATSWIPSKKSPLQSSTRHIGFRHEPSPLNSGINHFAPKSSGSSDDKPTTHEHL